MEIACAKAQNAQSRLHLFRRLAVLSRQRTFLGLIYLDDATTLQK